MIWQYLLLIPTTIFHLFLSWREKKTLTPPGELIDLGGYRVHLWVQGKRTIQNDSSKKVTIVLDHSLGGIEGYLLADRLAELGQVCIYDRPGYGWSDRSPKSRCSAEIVQELDLMLTKAQIEPPYILVGDSLSNLILCVFARNLQ